MRSLKTVSLSRRNFLIASAFAFNAKLNSKTAPSEKLNLAFIGTGAQGFRLLVEALKTERIQVRALCDIWEAFNLRRAKRILARYGQEANSYSDYQELISKEKDLDAVVIATPDCFHAEQTLKCLEAGLNVYCEVPMSKTAQEAKRVVEKARECGRVLQIGNQRRSDPRYRHCATTLLREVKLLGRIVAAEAQWHKPYRTTRGWPRSAPVPEATLKKYGFASMQEFRNWDRNQKFSAGPLFRFGSQQLDVINWFLGSKPKLVFGSGGTEFYDKKAFSVMDTFLGILEYELPSGNVRASYRVLTCNGNLGDYEKFLGDAGTLLLSEGAGKAQVIKEERIVGWERWVSLGLLKAKQKAGEEKAQPLKITDTSPPTLYEIPAKLKGSPLRYHLEDFFDAIKGRRKPSFPAEKALEAMVVLEKLKEAAQLNRVIKIEESDFSL